jgi:hypothetical protein
MRPIALMSMIRFGRQINLARARLTAALLDLLQSDSLGHSA